MASGDTHTGVDYWLNIPVKDLCMWLELMNEQAQQRQKAIERSRGKK